MRLSARRVLATKPNDSDHDADKNRQRQQDEPHVDSNQAYIGFLHLHLMPPLPRPLQLPWL